MPKPCQNSNILIYITLIKSKKPNTVHFLDNHVNFLDDGLHFICFLNTFEENYLSLRHEKTRKDPGGRRQ